MSAPPPPSQVSPDGKFYWDGERWLPMQGPAPPPVAPQVTAGQIVTKRGSMRVVVRGTLIRVLGFGGVFFALYQAVQAREPFAVLWLLIAFAILGMLVAWIVVRRGLR